MRALPKKVKSVTERTRRKMARNIYGIDLGTYEIKVYDKKQKTIWREKNAIAIRDQKYIFSVGDEAYEMYEKTPDNIQVVFPMKEGVISRFDDMQYLLQNLLHKDHRFARGSEYLVSVPTDVTEVEKKAFFDLVMHSMAKAKAVNIVERGVADALGMGLDVQKSLGIFIVNFGGETTDLSVLSMGGMVLNKMIKVGGIKIDHVIVNLIRQHYDFLIGRLTAESIRLECSLYKNESDIKGKLIAGRDLKSGVPKQKEIPLAIVKLALKDPLEECVREIKSMLERTPPEVLAAIQKNGIFITGGFSRLKGLAAYLEIKTGIPVKRAKNADINTAVGLEQVISNPDLKGLSYSMLDKNYRWMK